MITGQDAEQWHGTDRRWFSAMDIPRSRVFNTVQTAVAGVGGSQKSDPHDSFWQQANPNNTLANDCWGRPPAFGGFPIMNTEGLWEGQGRARQPLRIIWGFLAAGAHTMWADWNYDDGIDGGRHGSMGRGWIPVKPLTEHLFQTNQLGANCGGDEQ